MQCNIHLHMFVVCIVITQIVDQNQEDLIDTRSSRELYGLSKTGKSKPKAETCTARAP